MAPHPAISLFFSLSFPHSIYTDFSPISSPSRGGPLIFLRPLVGEPGTAPCELSGRLCRPQQGRTRDSPGCPWGCCRFPFPVSPHARNREWGVSSTDQGQPAYTNHYTTADCDATRVAHQQPAPASPPRPPARQRIGGLSATRHRAERERGKIKRERERENDARPGPCPALSPSCPGRPRPRPDLTATKKGTFTLYPPQVDQRRARPTLYLGRWTLATFAAAIRPRSPMSRSARLWRALSHCHDSLPRCCCRPP